MSILVLNAGSSTLKFSLFDKAILHATHQHRDVRPLTATIGVQLIQHQEIQAGCIGDDGTIELILGLSPLSQFDAAAPPMFAAFTETADTTPYTLEPARIDLTMRNSSLAYGAERSKAMDFSEYDRVDDFALNEILWHAVKGKNAPAPPAVRRAIASRVAVLPRP